MTDEQKKEINLLISREENNISGLSKHDKFFRKSMECSEVAYEFFNAHLPPEIKEMVDLSTLKIESNTYVDNDLRDSASDVVFSVKFKQKDGHQDGFLFLLLEHQSKPDHFMAFRLFKGE